MRVVLLGPPGAGKGTQAQIVAEKLSIPKVSTGDIFRANVSGGTELGKQAKAYMDRGDLVPDEVTNAMVRDRLAQDDAREGFLLDGFPRNVEQAETLDAILRELGQELDTVLEMVVETEEVVRRLEGRRTCRGCGKVHHVDYDPPRRPGVCDHCGGELFQRQDDEPETVRRRLEVYEEQTAPLVDFYSRRGVLVAIDATGRVEDVTERALQALGARGE